jgi:hypothetical protein
MSGCAEQYENVCSRQFQSLHRKLDQLDEAIRGNGKPGIQLRLDRLESAETARRRWFWLIAGAVVTFAGTNLWDWIAGG